MGLRLQLVHMLWLSFIILALVARTTADTGDSDSVWHSSWIDHHIGVVVIISIVVAFTFIVIVGIFLCFWGYWTAQPDAAPEAPPAAAPEAPPAIPAASAPQPLEIAMFPMSAYSIGGDDSFGSTACPICMDAYSEGQSLRIFPCMHRFCEDCTERTLAFGHTACPVCRMELGASTSSAP